jgi:hypothetical protein
VKTFGITKQHVAKLADLIDSIESDCDREELCYGVGNILNDVVKNFDFDNWEQKCGCADEQF